MAIIEPVTDWVEDRFGTVAAWITAVALVLLPIIALLAVLAYLAARYIP